LCYLFAAVRVGVKFVVLVAVTATGVVAASSALSATAAPRWLVFAARIGATDQPQLYRIQTDGKGLQKITEGANAATQPAFAPNGQQIVFSRLGFGIYKMNLDGTGLKRLTKNGRDGYPAWSPNGKQIAFNRITGKDWSLFVMNTSGGAVHRLKFAPSAGRPTWARDGKSIFMPSGGAMIRVDSRNGRAVKRYSARLDLSVSQGATVAPDGSNFAFIGSRAADGPEDCGESPCPQFALYAASARNGHRIKVANDAGPAGFSPDGKTIVYVAKFKLVFDVLKTGKKTTLDFGDTPVAQGDAAPAWQPR
jgi:Tol biopolymer transport system component